MQIKRRKFLQTGIGAVGAAALFDACKGMRPSSIKPTLAHKEEWTFVGSSDWSEDDRGIMYSPIWTDCVAKKGNDLLTREDFAYPPEGSLADTDLSMEFQTFYWSVNTVGVAFRAQDSVRFYYVEFEDMERKGSAYAVQLYLQDESGYRRNIASGVAPHRELPERIVQLGPKPDEWATATPGWMKARVQTKGDVIRVFVNDKKVLETRNATYSTGRAAICARGPAKFRNLNLTGSAGKLNKPWRRVPGEHPAYFYPYPDPEKKYGDNQTYPGICRMADDDLLLWMSVNGDPHNFNDFLLVRSSDEGNTWGEPHLVKKLEDGGSPGFFFGYKDGRISCLYTYDWSSKVKGPKIAFSSDKGKTWTKPKPLIVSGKPLYQIPKSGQIGPYSPITRYSDGTLLQFYYHMQTVPGGDVESNADRRDRSLDIRSTDDGKTWTGPYYLDAENFDSNETMAAERSDGSLIAFSRTLRAPSMWKTTSKDMGKTWVKQVPAGINGECPYLLRHSSGVLLMGSREAGIFIVTSTDEGATWSRQTRVSLCSGMMGMLETKDGRVLLVFHEAYRTPTRIRAQYIHVNKDGTIEPA